MSSCSNQSLITLSHGHQAPRGFAGKNGLPSIKWWNKYRKRWNIKLRDTETVPRHKGAPCQEAVDKFLATYLSVCQDRQIPVEQRYDAVLSASTLTRCFCFRSWNFDETGISAAKAAKHAPW